MEFNTPEEIGGDSKFLSEPGTYHFAVNKVAEGEGPKGGAIDGFSVHMQVLAGTTEDQEKKEFTLTFFQPKLTASEKAQQISRQQIAAFLIATELISPADLGKAVSIDLSKADGMQLIATLSSNEYQGKTNLQLHYSNIYHVDDPKAKSFPKNDGALSLLPTEKRKGESYFAPLSAKKKAAPAPAASALSNSDLDEL